MKKFLLNMFLLFLLFEQSGCVSQIMIRDAAIKKPGQFMYGQIPERDFYYNYAISDSLKFQTKYETNGSFTSTSPVILGKYLFVSTLSGKVYCFNVKNRKIIGAQKDNGSIPVAPIIFGQRIFFILNNFNKNYSTLFYYDFVTSAYISNYRIPGAATNELIKLNDGILLLSNDGTLYKFNLAGYVSWKIKTNTLTQSSPAEENNIVVWGNSNGEIIAVNLIRRKIIYREKTSNEINSGITIKKGKGYYGDSKGIVYGFYIKTGRIFWKFNTGSKIKNLPVLNKKNLFIGNLNGDIYSINLHNGKEKWKLSTGDLIKTTPVLFSNILIQPDFAGKILFINPNDGKIINIIKLNSRPRMTPFVFDNYIYFGIDKGIILSYKFIKR